MYFRDELSLHQIAKRTGLSRNTIRKWVRAPEGAQERLVLAKTQPQERGSAFRADQGRGLRRRLQPAHSVSGLLAGEQGNSLRVFVMLTFALGADRGAVGE